MKLVEILEVQEMTNVDRATYLFGCKVGKLPTYLGLSFGTPHKSCGVWDAIKERLKRKLATWKK